VPYRTIWFHFINGKGYKPKDTHLKHLRALHTKYWGRLLDVVMTELPDGPKSRGAVEIQDATYNVAANPVRRVGDDQTDYSGMEVDEDDASQRDVLPETEADLPPAAYFIDTKTAFPGLNSLFLRPEYIRVYNELKRIYNRYLETEWQDPPVAVVTGQPGIGACCCLVLTLH
jgi:hypothetical protein